MADLDAADVLSELSQYISLSPDDHPHLIAANLREFADRLDRPREPSPELREPQESVSADEVRGIFRDRETVEWDDEVRERPQEPPEGDG